MAQTILITGASSGLGLAFLEHYASLPSRPTIIALDSQPFPPQHPKINDIQFHQVDVTASPLLPSPSPQLSTTPIHLLFHCAGVRGLVPQVVQQTPGDVAAAETLEVMDQATMMRTFEINTWGAFNVIKTFLPNLHLAAEAADAPPRVVVLSSRVGSIESNTTGGAYAYRASKAALNAIVTSFSVDVEEVVFLLLHPGRVETGLVDWKEEGAVSVKESVKDCLCVTEQLDKNWSGRFVDRFGVHIPCPGFSLEVHTPLQAGYPNKV